MTADRRMYLDLPTPTALVDLDRLEANLARMQAYADAHGLALRPHTKTHKARWLAEEQVRRGAAGVTVATPVEAGLMSGASPELLVAYPALGPRAQAIAAVAEGTPTLVGLDSVAAVRELARAMDGTGETVGVLVEVDVGMHRCGVSDAATAVEVARACGDGVVYRGVMFYPGHIRQRVDRQDAALEALTRDLDGIVRALEEAGLAPAIVSGGSTPTAFRSHEVPGQTEIRPGTYVFNDRTTAAIGACARDDCAYTILATVVSTAVPGQAVVDAGSKALSSDPLRAEDGGGFGELLDRPDVRVARLSEEHGVLDLSRTEWRPSVGERVRIIPNHVCVSVNLQTDVHGVRGERVERSWAPEARGWGAPGPLTGSAGAPSIRPARPGDRG
ncbi:MAG TPA: alanine racemase [Longimicrobiales bacterium]|nr:alanine racemase [Longimicrobiales bacterium]